MAQRFTSRAWPKRTVRYEVALVGEPDPFLTLALREAERHNRHMTAIHRRGSLESGAPPPTEIDEIISSVVR